MIRPSGWQLYTSSLLATRTVDLYYAVQLPKIEQTPYTRVYIKECILDSQLVSERLRRIIHDKWHGPDGCDGAEEAQTAPSGPLQSSGGSWSYAP